LSDITNLRSRILTFKALGASLKWHQKYQQNLSQFPFVLGQLERPQFPRIVINKTLNRCTKKDRFFEHVKFGAPTNRNIEGNGNRPKTIVFATLDECLPDGETPAKLLGNFTDFCKGSEKGLLILIHKVFEELVDDQINDVRKAANVMHFRIPKNISAIEKERLQFADKRAVVAGIVAGNAEEISCDIVFVKNIKDNLRKILARVRSLNLLKGKQRLVKTKVFIDVMSSDAYTLLANVHRK
jgi:hypothetical protein